MANLRCSIWVYKKIDGKWKYCKPAVGRNNKITPEEGTYYIRWRRGGKLIWQKSSSAANAVLDAKRQEAYLNAVAHGLALHQTDGGKPEPLQMVYAMPTYLEEYKLSNRTESHALMEQTLNEFYAHCKKNLIGQITRLDLLRYKQWLIDKKRSPRTAGNKMLRVAQFLRHVQKQKPGEGLVTVKDARWVELEPEVYSDKELAAFFYNCTAFQYGVSVGALKNALLSLTGETVEWPTDDAFRAGWKSQPVYENLQQARIVHVLRRLSDSYLGSKSEHISIDSPLTVEHILPQNWVENWPLKDGSAGLTETEIWTAEDRTDPRVVMSEARNRLLQTIGNLTILTQALNSSVSNSAWEIKAPALAQASLLPINLQLHGVKTWDEATIEQRSDEMYSRAIKIWPRAN